MQIDAYQLLSSEHELPAERHFMTFNDARIRNLNDRQPDPAGDYVLYWMHGCRRLDRNHALDYALHWSRVLKKPLAIYEGLRLDYPWASARHHQFILEGMLDNCRKAREIGANYWPFVETPDQPARGLLSRVAGRACLVVSDDFPAFIVPYQNRVLAQRIDVAYHVVDGNGLIPLQLLGSAVSAAAHLRPRIHKLFAEAWAHRAVAEPELPKVAKTHLDPPFPQWNVSASKLPAFVRSLPLDQSVGPVPGVRGGTVAGRAVLANFVAHKLPAYATGRNQPDDPADNAASGLSAYLHYGHLSIQEIVETVLGHAGPWSTEMLNATARGKRDGFFHRDDNVNSFLDEAITWRDVGYHWHFATDHVVRKEHAEHTARRLQWPYPTFCDLQKSLPAWAWRSLQAHAADPRPFVYTLDEFESAQTHDPLWNAAQRELVATGRIHNYLRMLWGKKVLEWSRNVEMAYLTLEHLNNKYALDGRDPNSYTGILWCFGLFDRPWVERKIFGLIRYMSSDNTAKKFDLDSYYEYVDGLPKVPSC